MQEDKEMEMKKMKKNRKKRKMRKRKKKETPPKLKEESNQLYGIDEEKRLENLYAPKPPLPLSQVEKLYLPSYVPPKPASVYDPSDRPITMGEELE
jgi:hypothetical protein